METEVTIEGVKHTVEIDLAAMGHVSKEKADAIRTESYKNGFDKRGDEVTTGQTRITELETLLNSTKKTSDNSNTELEELKTTVLNLTTAMQNQQEATTKAQYANVLAVHAETLNLVEGAGQVFADMARNAGVEVDGVLQYNLPEGGIGSLEVLSSQWAKSSVGKSLSKSNQLGGGGTAKPGDGVPSAIFKTQADHTAYALENGRPAYLVELQRQKALPKAS